MISEKYFPDYLHDINATRELRNRIERYWNRRGKDVKVYIEKEVDPVTKSMMYVIRSNIKVAV